MSGTTTFILFRVTIEPKDKDSFQNFQEILDTPLDEYQPMASNGNRFELEGKIRQTQGLYYGTFCLNQTQELPPIVKFGAAPKELLADEDDDTGIGHYTSFFYDPMHQMVGIQNNRNGISANGIAAFFKRNYEMRDILFEFVINPAELARLNNLTEISSFEVSIAKMENGSAFSSNSDSLTFRQATKVADDTNANVFKLFYGVGYQRGATLRKGSVIDYIKSILGKGAVNNITKIEIKGRETDDANMHVIDLINNKIKLIVTLPRARSINASYNQKIITKAIQEYKDIVPELKSYKIKAKT